MTKEQLKSGGLLPYDKRAAQIRRPTLSGNKANSSE
jgi:hypothetical protein